METQRLLGKIEEELKWLKEGMDRMEKKVDTLVSFKWKIVGGSVTLSCVVALLFQIFRLGNK